MTKPTHDERTAEGTEELRVQLEHSREELGQTVEALVARTDVKARAQEKAAEVKEQAAVKAAEVKEQAAAKAAEVKEQAAAKAIELKAKAAGVAHQVQDKLPGTVRDNAARAVGEARAQAAQAGRVWEERAPEPLRQKAALGARAARDKRTVLLVAAAAP
ncbi:DUF3618 domain-containing protein [Streptomyces cynarae]|uniref:DUF3618 domain-containing protein n=1 Tax=Streptomyces cynarae TaxID=2981134 RepID=A0ABY6E9I8_9ACTN|nr:DUF3618 domain-containing protein [Streptomyces cynarae]UXY20728.1 DUF3618 domain-containing protein [Streptomyces cynarae]